LKPIRMTTTSYPGHRSDTTAKGSIRPWLQLVRAPNLFTAVADVLAGALVVSGWGVFPSGLIKVGLCSACLYAAGCALNDFADRRLDAIERPERPLPSGKIGPFSALGATIGLMVLGLAGALSAGWAPFLVALALSGAIVSYDLLTKGSPWVGPLNMGCCRGLNLLLGMSLAFGQLGTVWLLPVINLIYVFGVTSLSQHEVNIHARVFAATIFWTWFTVILCLAGLFGFNMLAPSGFIFFLAFCLWTAQPLFRLILDPHEEGVGQAVKLLILAIPLLDGIYAGGFQGYLAGGLVVLLIVPTLYLSRSVFVT